MANKTKRQNARRTKVQKKEQAVEHLSRAATQREEQKPEEPEKGATAPSPKPDSRPVSIVGIGASAGGLEAFEQLLAALPPDSGMGFVLVQHLAPKHESILSELLGRATMMPVVEVTQGMRVEANHVYVIPPNADMSVSDGVLHLSPLSPDRARRMPIDLFLRSLAEDQQARAIGVILSGTASDGTLGLQAIKAMGGVTFAQDEESAKYNAMPRSAIAAGGVDFVLPPDLIARELKRIAKHVHIFATEDQPGTPDPTSDGPLQKIFAILKNKTRVDFSLYKPGTIKRRITRRMFLRKIDDLDQYLQFVRKNGEEVEALFNDVLINVTGFFRDAEAFESLRKEAFPPIMKNKGPNSPIRIWVPGCSTGEEAYSLAIAFLEYLGERASALQIQIFATDVSEPIIQKARAGMYPESIAMDVTSDRLRRYFQKVDSGYQISKRIRDMCVFAKQDIAKDPPFSKLDMISCRNVMIYMGQVLQKRILPLFHYALNPGGVLFLGTSETVGNFGDLFVAVDKKYRIYTKKPVSVAINFDFVPQFDNEVEHKPHVEGVPPRVDLQKAAEQLLLNRYAPASVMVNEKLDIVQFIGQTGRFLDPAPGDASLSLLRMVKSGLHLELRLAFQRVRKDGTTRREGILVEQNGGLKNVDFEIISVKNLPGRERYYLVVFEESPRLEPKKGKTEKDKAASQKKGKPTSQVEADNSRLKEELDATREYLQSIIEEQRTTNEELRSANEEIQSSNEELQSINEELETAKEELQSTNEELTTVNEEMQNRNDELTRVNNDLSNLLSSVNIPIVMLGSDLRVRRFTPMAEKVMNLIPSDIGRPVTDLKPNLKMPDLRQSISRVIDSLEIQENEVEDNSGRWYSMRIRPYRTMDNKIDGVVIVLLDLDSRLRPKQS
jgi:two-component system, chemotaxis family, CheB/CheR fusion protein